jgi:hypothetical protein
VEKNSGWFAFICIKGAGLGLTCLLQISGYKQKKKEIRPDFIRGRAASKSNGIKTQKKRAAYGGDLGSTADAATAVDKYACGSKASVGSALMDFRKSLTPEWKKEEEKKTKPFLWKQLEMFTNLLNPTAKSVSLVLPSCVD